MKRHIWKRKNIVTIVGLVLMTGLAYSIYNYALSQDELAYLVCQMESIASSSGELVQSFIDKSNKRSYESFVTELKKHLTVAEQNVLSRIKNNSDERFILIKEIVYILHEKLLGIYSVLSRYSSNSSAMDLGNALESPINNLISALENIKRNLNILSAQLPSDLAGRAEKANNVLNRGLSIRKGKLELLGCLRHRLHCS